MNEKVAILGWAQSEHEFDMQKTREEMVFDVVREALDNADVKREDLDTVINASNDFLDGRTISNVHLTMPEGGYMKDESKVEDDGAFAGLYGIMRILSGVHDVCLVVGNTQGSTFNPHQVSKLELDPLFDEQVGILNDMACAGIQARKYMNQFDVDERQIAKVSVKNIRNAADNPKAQRKKRKISLGEVLESEEFYNPIRELTSYPISDGACALLLASGEKAEQITDDPVWIKGVGSCQDPYLRNRRLYTLESLKKAAGKAYERAELNNPNKIDLMEISEKFAHEELMAYEALGLCKKGEGSALIENSLTEKEGETPVNPSGGALSANPVCATGLIRLAEAAMQIKGEAGERQVPNVERALAHGQSGLCAQSNVVFILEGGES